MMLVKKEKPLNKKGVVLNNDEPQSNFDNDKDNSMNKTFGTMTHDMNTKTNHYAFHNMNTHVPVF